jgi:hypothetical protein
VSLKHAIDEVCEAIGAGRAQSVRDRTLLSAWDDELTPASLLRHANRSGQKLVLGTKLFEADGFAATELAWYNDDGPKGVVWVVWCETGGLWKFAGRVDNETIAKAYVVVGAQDAPTLDRWAGGSALQELAQTCLWAVDGNEAAPFSGDVWEEWTADVEGEMSVCLGRVIEAPTLGRAMIVLEWVEKPDPGYPDTERAGILNYVQGAWELMMVRHMGRLRSLLHGLDFKSPNQRAIPEIPLIAH